METSPVVSDVARFMNSLRKAGTTPTVDAVYAAFKGRVSFPGTIRLMAEAIAWEAEQYDLRVATAESSSSLKLVVDEDCSHQGMQGEELPGTLNVLIADAEGLARISNSAAEKIERLEAERCSLISELKQCRVKLTMAGEHSGNSEKVQEQEDQSGTRKTLGL